jgi:hypothetical protein
MPQRNEPRDPRPLRKARFFLRTSTDTWENDMIVSCRCPCSSTSRSAARSATRCGRARPGSAGNPVSARRPRKAPSAAGAWGTCSCPARPAMPNSATRRSTSHRTTSGAARPVPGSAYLAGRRHGTVATFPSPGSGCHGARTAGVLPRSKSGLPPRAAACRRVPPRAAASGPSFSPASGRPGVRASGSARLGRVVRAGTARPCRAGRFPGPAAAHPAQAPHPPREPRPPSAMRKFPWLIRA